MRLHRLIDLAKNKYDEDVTRLMGVAARLCSQNAGFLSTHNSRK